MDSDAEEFELECSSALTKADIAKQNKILLRGRGYMMEEEGEKYDKESSELFPKVLPGEGDEFMAVKPWLGAIKEPIPKPKVNEAKPA